MEKYCVVMNYSKSHSCPAFGQNFALLDVRDKLTNDQKMSAAGIAFFLEQNRRECKETYNVKKGM